MSDQHRLAFRYGLEKLGMGAQLTGLAQNLGRRALAGGGMASLGGAGGAALGAVGGGIQGYRNREEGTPGAIGALQGALQGAAVGGAGGAALGGAVGLGGGQRVQGLVNRLAQPGAAKPGFLGGLTRFGQRQAHSLTGALPEGYASRSAALESIGGGVAPMRRTMASLQEQAAKGPMTPKLQQQIESAQKGIAAGENTVNMGMTSVPGLFKALATDPRRALSESAKYQWHSNPGIIGKALTLGMPAAFVGGEALRESKPGEEGRVTRTAKALASSLPFALGPMPIAGAMASSSLMQGAAGLATKPFRKDRLGKTPGPPLPEDGGLGQNVEHVYSPSAQGVYPEGIGV